MAKVEPQKFSLILCGEITRLLRTVRKLRGIVYVVGGVVTEGATARDLDIVISNLKDVPIIKKALGKYAPRIHFIYQKGEPPATLFVKITGKEAKNAEPLKKGQKISKYQYAGR